MDKYEYQVCQVQIKNLIAEKRFAEATEIADTVDWRRVRSVSMLVTVSELYKVNKRYEDAKDILLLAYERHPTGRDIVYALCELFIKLGDVVQAVESYKEFMAIAPDDPNSLILLYKLYKAQEVSIEEQIEVLEEYKNRDYREKWAYELAYLYHSIGQEAKCVATCDELILWFGEGKYVRKAMELKMKHQALSADQQAKFDGRSLTGGMPTFEQPIQQSTQFGNNAQQTGPMLNQYGEYIQQTGALGTTGQIGSTGQLNTTGQINTTGQLNTTGQIGSTGQFNTTGQIGIQDPYRDLFTPAQPVQNQYTDPYGNPVQFDAYGNPIQQITPNMYQDSSQGIQVTPGMNHLGMTQDIMAQALGTGVWNTVDMQDQLGSQVRDVMMDQGQYIQDSYSEPIQNTSEQQYDDVQEIKEEPVQEPVKVEPEKPAISVNTGIIDISEADLLVNSLPGDELPEEESVTAEATPSSERVVETGDIMDELEGVIPGSDITGVSSTVNGPKTKSRITGQIPAFLPAGEDGEEDENSSYEIKDEPETEEQEISRISAIQEKAFPGYTVPEVPAKVEAEEADSDEPTVETATGEVANKEPDKVIEESSIVEEVEDGKEDKSVIEEEKPVAKEKEVSAAAGHYPYDTVTDIGYVEELPEIEQPDDVDDILKTSKLPTDEISKAVAYETDSQPEIEEYEVEEVDDDDDDNQMPPFMRGDVRARREFDDDEYKIFCRYDGMEALKAQLVDAMDLMSMAPESGNIIIMGPESVDRKGIAISIVKAMQQKNPAFSGKVAKISGEALNKKNIKNTLDKLENGALIVERAGGLTRESVLLITGALSEGASPVLVILEGIREEMKPLFRYTKAMKSVFNARLDIAEYTNEDLVNYGRGYALEKEYSIDEMGGLALHNRISEMQTFDHKVTLDEVRELIDLAISHVDRKNMGHFMDMLLGRRYDDEDNIILSEKDFIF